MKIAIIYHSLTGNTEYIAKYLEKNLNKENSVDIFNLKNKNNFKQEDYNFIIICFWVNKSTINKQLIQTVQEIKNNNIYLVGTVGLYPRSLYGIKVKTNAISLVDSSNKIKGITLVNGKISKAVKRFFKVAKFIPKMSEFHSMTPERKIFYDNLSHHSNENDAKEVLENIKSKINNIV